MPTRFEGSIRSKRRRRGTLPRAEAMEDRRLLASLGGLLGAAAPAAETAGPEAEVDAPPAEFQGGLASFSDSGVSDADGITNVSRPTFLGVANAWASVQIFAAGSSWPSETRLIGQTIAGSDGSWTVQSAFLHDGVHTITAVETPLRGSPRQPVVIAPALTIDTVGPRVSGLAFNPGNGAITTVISDVGSGVDEASAMDPTNYTVVPPSTIIGRHPGVGGGPIVAPSIAGFYSDAEAYTVQLQLGGGGGRGWPRGRYRFQVRSGGVADRAGNALDGEFAGSLPSGDGVAGGNFIADLFNRQVAQRPARPRPARR